MIGSVAFLIKSSVTFLIFQGRRKSFDSHSLFRPVVG